MSKSRSLLEKKNQQAFDFEDMLSSYQSAREEVLEACDSKPEQGEAMSCAETCVEIAAAIKRSLRSTGLSREEIVDRINEYFPGGKQLSLHMFNHYLSKPDKYPIPAYLIIPLQEITGSLEIAQTLVEPTGGRVISRNEVRHMNLGRLDELISEMQHLKREIKRK